MRTRWLLSLITALAGSGAFPAVVSGQVSGGDGATRDQARLVFSVSAGALGGRQLWASSPQAVQFIDPADTFALQRRIRSTLAVGFGGTYFPMENLGFAVDGFLVGLGFENSCGHVFSSGSGDAAELCRSIQGREIPASAVALSVGPVVRFNSRKLFSQYARANLGFVFSTQSAIRTSGVFPTADGPSAVDVYSDNSNSRVEPSLALGLGFTAAVAKSYHLRWEIRDNIVGVQQVTGTIPIAGFVPPHKRVFKHLFSLTVGFDVILERRKGRRY